jgi:hypothetical protein
MNVNLDYLQLQRNEMPFSHIAKSIYKISEITREQDEFTGVNNPLLFNHKCYGLLKKQKNRISSYNTTRKWDKYKKYLNDFELVFTTSNGYPNISQYTPISRSFFKLWEILHDFINELPSSILDNTSNLKTCSVAEGPGGFIEALVKYRRDLGTPCTNDKYFGMTLFPYNKSVPQWKFSSDFIKLNNITLSYGKDGSGSLYNMDNIDYLTSLIGQGTCDLVTGDGGFDYSYDFNEQEEATLPLLMCESLAALSVQKKGGSFILKIFDISTPKMFQLLFLLYNAYDSVYITKPFSSRPANSEKYLVCCGYKAVQKYVDLLRSAIALKKTILEVPITFHKEIVYYNTHYTIYQTITIMQTLDFIDDCEAGQLNTKIAPKLKSQIECALRWCHKYKLNVNIASISQYKNILKDLL